MRTRTLMHPMRALLSAWILGAATLTVAGIAPGTETQAAAVERREDVLTPRPDEILSTNRIRIRVLADDRARVRALLNGVDVSDELDPARDGVRSLRASVSHGLRRGDNVLRVTVRPFGEEARTTIRRFIVVGSRPLVGAGRDRRVVTGERILLTSHQAPRGGESLDAGRWSVVKTPQGARARLISPDGPTARLTPEGPGEYTLRFTVGNGANAISDELVVEAGPTSPMVSVDTMAGTSDAPGIRVGDQVYLTQRPNSADGSWIQVLVLDRSNLAVVSNASYGSDAVAAALAGLDDTKLVLVAMQDSGTGGKAGEVLTGIGVPNLGPVFDPRTFSAIGIPKMTVGAADWNVYPIPPGQNPTTPLGRMTGYLMRDALGNYGFVPDGRRPFTYGGSQVDPCPGATDDSHIGYRVRVQNARTLDSSEDGTFDCQMFDTNGRGLSVDKQAAEALRMVQVLSSVAPDDVVTIQAVSNRASGEAAYPPPVGMLNRATMTVLAAAVANVGGTRNGFNLAARTSGTPASGGAVYTLVGWGAAGEARGAEVAAGVDGAVPVMSGVLRPDNQSRYRPAQVSPSLVGENELSRLVQQLPTTGWPYDGDAAVTAAIACIGNVLGFGDDPRSAYWNLIQNQADATAKRGVLATATFAQVTCAGKRSKFGRPAFNKAKTQILQELDWVAQTLGYLQTVSTPVATSGDQGWAMAKDIADNIYNDANQPQASTAWKWLDLISIILKTIGPLTDGVTTVIGGALDVVVWGFGDKSQGTLSYVEYQVTADGLGQSFLNQADDANRAFKALGHVILSDYAKLSVVGTCGGTAPAGCAPGWKFTTDDVVRASRVVEIGIGRVAYTKLLPLGYPVFQLSLTQPLANPPDPHAYLCRGLYYPYVNIPTTASTSLLLALGQAEGTHQWQTFVLGRVASNTLAAPPPDGILTKMFTPIDPTLDRNKGGLGMTITELIWAAQGNWTWWEGEDNDGGHCE